MSALPTELLEYILDFVHPRFLSAPILGTSRSTLIACANSCHTFNNIIQKRLFKSISIKYALIGHQNQGASIVEYPLSGGGPGSGSSFLRLIRGRSGHLAEYVERLEVKCYQDISYHPRAPPSNITSMASILKMLRNLKALVFGGSLDIVWDWMPFDTQRSFRGFLQTSRLESLDLTRLIDFPATMLHHCTSIRRLSFTSLSFSKSRLESVVGQSGTKPRPDQVSHPEYIHYTDAAYSSGYGETTTVLTNLGFPLSFDSLQCLAVSEESIPSNDLSALLDLCPATLSNFQLDLGSYANTQYTREGARLQQHAHDPPPSLSRFTHLKFISLRTKVSPSAPRYAPLAEYCHAFPWISLLLASASGHVPGLRCVRLRIGVHYGNGGTSYFDRLRWERIADALTPREIRASVSSPGTAADELVRLELEIRVWRYKPPLGFSYDRLDIDGKDMRLLKRRLKKAGLLGSRRVIVAFS